MRRLAGVKGLVPRGILVALVSALLVVLAAPVSSAAQQRNFEVLYRVDPATSSVLVELRLQLQSSHGPDFWIHDAATAVEAFVDDAPIAVSVGSAEELERRVSLDIPSSATELLLRYSIPSAPPRSDGYTRVNPAYVSFLGFVDSSLGSGSARVELPPGFSGALDRGVFDIESRTDAGEVWVARAIGSGDYFTQVVARNQAGLEQSVVPVDGREITIAGWKDDPEWIAFAEDAISWGVPKMVDLIGQPWPEGDLVVLESTVPAEFGYGGWFSVWRSEIEVGDQLDETLLLHELSHAWFHNERIEDRWITEGWAEDFSALALSEETGEVIAPPLPDLSAPGTTELARWGASDDFGAVLNRYNTSWFVLKTVREEIGNEAMADVLAVIFEGRRSYHVDGDAVVFPSTSTARLLDLFEDVGGSEQADALFRTYVFPSGTAATLNQRAAVRANYATLLEVGDFAAPAAVRDRLGKWRFAEADLLIAEARPVAERLAALQDRTEALGIELPAALVRSYEIEATPNSQVTISIESAHAALTSIEAMADPEEQTQALQRFAAGTSGAPSAGAAGVATDPWYENQMLMGGAAVVVLALFGGFAALAFKAARAM